MDWVKKVGLFIAGLGLSGVIGLISSILLLYVLVDASIAGADDAVWLFLCAAVGVIVGGICFYIVLWASRGRSAVR